MRLKIIFFSLAWLTLFVIPISSGAEESAHKEVQTVILNSEDEFYDLIDKGRFRILAIWRILQRLCQLCLGIKTNL